MSKSTSALLQWVRDQLGFGGSVTENKGLHPNHQEALARAYSTLESMFGEFEPIQSLGLADIWHVRKFVRASWTSSYGNLEMGTSGDEARFELGLDMPTKVFWLFGATKRWETTANAFLVTVPSSTSGRCAVVLGVLPRQDDATGWLSWSDGVAVVSYIFDTVDEAESAVDDVRRAIRTISATREDALRLAPERVAQPVDDDWRADF